MNHIWLVIWATLFLGQVVTLRWGGALAEGGTPEQGSLQSELLEVALLTAEEWERLTPPEEGFREESSRPRDGDLLVQREEWLLELKDIEQSLIARGAAVHIASDLNNWIAASGRFLEEEDKQAMLVGYITGLTDWLLPFLEPGEGLSLGKAALQPDSSTDYPALVFELGGDPQFMGRYLWSHSRIHPRWTLMEMELMDNEAPSTWWLMGSYVFLGSSPQ